MGSAGGRKRHFPGMSWSDSRGDTLRFLPGMNPSLPPRQDPYRRI
ncbi:hypothetical protein ASZ90_016634 [hydrocarbon metagenome]|uniref:Uncharacterized protein n=1 Tax=hydrocarbon metagenome TaxID=938273 RepID=A0A0W8EKW4_9ZZZZ